MIYYLNFIFAAVSAICAVISLILSNSAKQSKNKSQEIKEEIYAYRKNTKEKNDLILLKQAIEPIKNLSDEFCKISTKKIPQPGDNKNALAYYSEHFETLNKLSYDIPEKYKEVKKSINYLKEGLNTCIVNKKTFDKLDSSSLFNYMSMIDNYSTLIDNLNTITSDLLI